VPPKVRNGSGWTKEKRSRSPDWHLSTGIRKGTKKKLTWRGSGGGLFRVGVVKGKRDSSTKVYGPKRYDAGTLLYLEDSVFRLGVAAQKKKGGSRISTKRRIRSGEGPKAMRDCALTSGSPGNL